MKKNYQKPTVNVANIQSSSIICVSQGTVNKIGGDTFKLGGGGYGTGVTSPRSRDFGGFWDDDEE